MNGLHKMALATTVAGVALLTGTSAHAQFLNGSLPLGGLAVAENGPNLFLSTQVTTVSDFTSGPGAGNYSAIPFFTMYTATPLILANPIGFKISNVTWGNFTASSDTIVSHTPFFYEVLLDGVYTPGPGFPGKLPTPGELRISINQSGKSLSEALTLTTQGRDVPEPGSVAMLIGLSVSGAGFLLRKRNRK